MTVLQRFLPSYSTVGEEQAKALMYPATEFSAVEIRPPWNEDIPETVEKFVRGVLEVQTRLLGVKNTSPTVVYEIMRPKRDRLWLQFCVPNQRLDRKVRTHLSTTVPGIGFADGVTKLPVLPGDSIGGGILTTGKADRFPIRTEFNAPPINSLVAALHRDSMRGTRFVIQVLLKPVAGRSVRDWERKRRSKKTVDYLRKEKKNLSSSRSATQRERDQANLVEAKMAQRRFWVSIRFAVIGAKQYTPSRVKEVAGSFNIFENPETGQYFTAKTVRGVRKKRFLRFYQAIGSREFSGHSLKFQASIPEVAGLVSIPSLDQENVQYAQP